MVFFHASFCRLLIFFKINFCKNFFKEYYQYQTVWIQIRPDILSGLIRVQTVCKEYQQMTLVGIERVNRSHTCMQDGNFTCFFCHLMIFFKKLFKKYSQCQTVWIQIRPDILSALIWVQTAKLSADEIVGIEVTHTHACSIMFLVGLQVNSAVAQLVER